MRSILAAPSNLLNYSTLTVVLDLTSMQTRLSTYHSKLFARFSAQPKKSASHNEQPAQSSAKSDPKQTEKRDDFHSVNPSIAQKRKLRQQGILTIGRVYPQ